MRKNLLVFLAWLEFREPEGGVVGDKGAGDEVSINMLVGPPFLLLLLSPFIQPGSRRLLFLATSGTYSSRLSAP